MLHRRGKSQGTTRVSVNNHKTFFFIEKLAFLGGFTSFWVLRLTLGARRLVSLVFNETSVFTHFRCRLKKKHKKTLLFVCLLRQTSHRRVLFLSGETILCTFNRQTNGTGLLSQFYRCLCTFSLFCLSLCLHKTGTAESHETDSTFTLKGYPSALQPNSCHVFWEHYSAFEILPW